MLLVPTITNELDTAPKIFHPWQYLPIELKIMILDVPLRLTRAVRFLTHPSHVNRALQSLTLTSKEMRSLALQVYYGNAVMLEPVFRSRKLDPQYELRFVLAYPKPVIGALVRRLQLQLQVDDGFNFLAGCDALRPKTNQWWLLLRLNAVVMLNTRHFSVKVSGFACAGFVRTQKAVGVQCPNECSEKVAATIKDVFRVRRAIEK
ncbi:hypothetical protein HBH96_203790 [Parastagonospora nodorum]|nr:hypothetical protein HBH96_203790 [Parastagonospora nodorum]